MAVLQKGGQARWLHVPPGGGYGYATNVVTVLALLEGGRWAKIEAMAKDGYPRVLTVKPKNLEAME